MELILRNFKFSVATWMNECQFAMADVIRKC